MKKYMALVVVVLGLVVARVQFLNPDLRGWTPSDPHDPASVVEPTLLGGAAFTVGECLPGSVRPWDTPTAEEYSGTATLTVLTCRSQSSAIRIALTVGGAITCVLGILLAARWRKKAK